MTNFSSPSDRVVRREQRQTKDAPPIGGGEEKVLGSQRECEWIRFDLVGPTPSGKTQIWNVVLKDQSVIGGQVRWFGAWRKYAFFPNPSTLYEQDCLRDIARFIESQTLSQRTQKAI